MNFRFKGTEETHVELPDGKGTTINVVPGEVVELEHELKDLAEHLWEETKDMVHRPEQSPAEPPNAIGTDQPIPVATAEEPPVVGEATPAPDVPPETPPSNEPPAVTTDTEI